jgi:hypothetical protein
MQHVVSGKFSYFGTPINFEDSMKRIIGLTLAMIFMASMFSSCLGGKKRAGYVSKYPCHQRHPCDH